MPYIRDIFIKASTGWWVIDDLSQAKVEANSFRNLKHTIIEHRRGNDLDWDHSEVEEMIHRQICEREPESYCRAISPKTPSRRTVFFPAQSWGPPLWESLHLAAISGELSESWLREWAKAIPQKGCSCKSSWKQILSKHPFSPTFEWTVKVHNAVSRKLNKKGWTVEQAMKRWAKIS